MKEWGKEGDMGEREKGRERGESHIVTSVPVACPTYP
jgi:hypothetical protein